MYNYEYVDFSDLVGKTLIAINKMDNEEIEFITNDGFKYRMFHEQDCCECVTVEDIVGDLNDLLNQPILLAEETQDGGEEEYGDSFTWTFYKLATNLGRVTIRWYGTSNGYYSESVSFQRQPINKN